MPSWGAEIIASVFALVIISVVVWRLSRRLSKENFVVTIGYLGAALVVGFIAWLIRGFSVSSFVAAVGVAYVAMFLGSGGQPEQIFEIWLRESPLSKKQSAWVQIRLIVVTLAVGALSLPVLFRML